MKVSVLMPVFNARSYIAEAVQSVLCQSYSQFELIIIDDGSTDGSAEQITRCCGVDARVRLVRRDNRGLIATLNEGIERAGGEYIARMDADDVCDPARFEKQLAYLDANPHVVCVGSQVLLIDPAGRPLKVMDMPLDHESIDRGNASGNTTLTHPSVMMRREALQNIGGYSIDYAHAEDIDLWLRLAEIGTLANLPDILLVYRQHPGSVGGSQRIAQRHAQWRAARDAALRRGKQFVVPEPDALSLPESDVAFHRCVRWGWWALNGGNVGPARLYALRAVVRQPRNAMAWRLAACAIRGH